MVVVTNFNVSEIDKDKVKQMLHTEIKEEHELDVLDILELEDKVKRILRESSLHPVIKKHDYGYAEQNNTLVF